MCEIQSTILVQELVSGYHLWIVTLKYRRRARGECTFSARKNHRSPVDRKFAISAVLRVHVRSSQNNIQNRAPATNLSRLNSSRERKPRKTRGRRFQITSMICTYIPTAVSPSVCSTHGDDASTAREPLFFRSTKHSCTEVALQEYHLPVHDYYCCIDPHWILTFVEGPAPKGISSNNADSGRYNKNV